jgi:glutaconyl-CoA decarboxylase
MRVFKITVDGKTYDVAVEEISTENRAAAPFKTARPAPVAPKSAPVSEVAPKSNQEQKVVAQQPVAANGTVVAAPMPGTILNILVKEGAKVKSGEVLLILEAMKMENEITSPTAGTVKKVAVSKGSNVNTGEVLVIIE